MIDPVQHIKTFYKENPKLGEVQKMEELSGGNLNFVYRIWDSLGKSQIAKYAPPFIAVLPDVEMNPDRILFEIKMMELLGGGALSEISTKQIRPPELIAKSASDHVFVMEDIQDSESLDELLLAGTVKSELGAELGCFIGNLHKKSVGLEEAREVNNESVQQTRLEVQYKSLANLLEEKKVTNASDLGKRIVDLGERLLLPGKCLLMGDLWPRSILIQNKNVLRIIDWEFAHFGCPCQDIAHFAAHCWLLENVAENEEIKKGISQFYVSFMSSYKEALKNQLTELWDKKEIKDASIHFGCEILVRTHGSFQSGYLFEEDEDPDQDFLDRSLERSISAIKEFNFSI